MDVFKLFFKSDKINNSNTILLMNIICTVINSKIIL